MKSEMFPTWPYKIIASSQRPNYPWQQNEETCTYVIDKCSIQMTVR